MKVALKIFLTLFLFLTSAFYTQDNQHIVKINIDNPSEYLPEYLIDIYIGMPFNDFTNIKDTMFLQKVKSDSPEWFAFREEVNDNYIDHIIYKFDATPDSINNLLPLYQINIFYTEEEELNRFVFKKFGDPLFENSDDLSARWILKTNKNFVLIVKKENMKVKLIATIAGAEWDPND